MAVALVQDDIKIENGVATSALAYASNVASGNLLVVTASAYSSANPAPLTISDSLGHTWTAVLGMAQQTIVAGDQALVSWWAVASSSAACTVTIGSSDATADFTFTVSEWSGVDTADPFTVGAVATGTGTSTTPDSGTIDPDVDPGVLYGACIHADGDTSFTEDGAWTLLGENEAGASSTTLNVAWRSLTSGTDTASWTLGTSTEWACHGFGLKQTPTPAGGTLPTIRVDAAFGLGAYSTPAGGDWVDITADVFEIQTQRGRQSEFDQFPAGTATVGLYNDTRQYDPLNTAGAHYGQLKANVPIRVVATISAVDYHIWRGYVDGWPITYTDAGARSEVHLRCTDALRLLAERKMPDTRETFFALFGPGTPGAFYKCDDPITFVNSGTVGRDGTPATALALTDPLCVGSANALSIPSATPRPGGTLFAIGITAPLSSDNFLAGTDWTMAVTVLFTSNGARTIFNSTACELEIDASGNLAFTVNGVGATLSATTTGVDYADGFAHRLTLVRDNTAATLYANGTEVSTDTDAGATSAPAVSGYTIGATPVGGGIPPETFPAFVIDELMAWPGVAFTPTEVAELDTQLTVGFAAQRPSGLVVGDILDTIAWPASLRNLDGGEVVVQPPGNPQGNGALDLLHAVTTTEDGRLFVDAQGRIVFHERSRFLSETVESTVQYTFSGQTRDSSPSGVGLLDNTLSLVVDDRLTFQGAEITREGGTTQTAISTNPPARTYSATGLLSISDTQALNLAQWIVFRYATDLPRSESWQIDPETMPADWDNILTLDIGHRIKHDITPGPVGNPINLEQHLSYISHDITTDQWLITLNGTPTDPNETAYFLWASTETADDDNGWGDPDGTPPGGYWG